MPLEKEWKVHLIRGGQSIMGEPTYRYGRTVREIGRGRGRVVPSDGLMSHITRIGMEDDLSETGVTIYLSRRSFEGDGQRFKRILTAETPFQKTHIYASDHPDENGTVVIYSFECDCGLPPTVWIKVRSLEPEILAASLAEEWIDGGPDSRQSKIADFADIEVETCPNWCSTDEEDARGATAKSVESVIRDIIGGPLDDDEGGSYPVFQLPGPPLSP